MGGRRSRYWCGPGSFRETKKAPARGFIGQWSAPASCSAGGFGRRHSSGRSKRKPKGIEGRTNYQTVTPDHLYKRDSQDARSVKPFSPPKSFIHKTLANAPPGEWAGSKRRERSLPRTAFREVASKRGRDWSHSRGHPGNARCFNIYVPDQSVSPPCPLPAR
jgi:hypothetical protein